MIPDRYRTPPQAPPLFTATPESIVADAKKLTESGKAVLDKIVADVSVDNASFANVEEPILLDDNVASISQRILTFYQHVSPNDELREASNKAELLLDDFRIEQQMREDIFKLVDAAFASRKSQTLEPEQLHVLEKDHKSYIQNGLELPAGPKRDRFKEIQKRLSQLCIQGQKNLNEEKGEIWFTPEELDGVPADDIDVEQLEKGTGENEGKVKLTFKYNHYLPAMKYAKNEETRKRYAIAEANKVRTDTQIMNTSSQPIEQHQRSHLPRDHRAARRSGKAPRFRRPRQRQTVEQNGQDHQSRQRVPRRSQDPAGRWWQS